MSKRAASRVEVLIVDGQNSHAWPELTTALRGTLAAARRFDVEVATSPPREAAEEDWGGWRPVFSDYAAVVINYQGRELSETLRDDFEAYVRSGGGAVVVHSCVGAFGEWRAYLEMIGLGWRSAWEGDHVFVDDAGEVVRTPPFHGVGAGHGKQHVFPVRNRRPDHPIMQGVPDVWMHGKDELYHGMRGPAKNLTVLATAYSAKDQWGSGDHEPMLWTTSYGEGRVVTTVLGHRFYDHLREQYPVEGENGADAVHCVGFQTLVARSVEWAATGSVTLAVPEPFPTAAQTSIVDPAEVHWA